MNVFLFLVFSLQRTRFQQRIGGCRSRSQRSRRVKPSTANDTVNINTNTGTCCRHVLKLNNTLLSSSRTLTDAEFSVFLIVQDMMRSDPGAFQAVFFRICSLSTFFRVVLVVILLSISCSRASLRSRGLHLFNSDVRPLLQCNSNKGI